MARKKRSDGPGLFGDDPPPDAPPGPDRAALRPVVAELAAEVMAEERARHLEAVRRYEHYNDRLAADRGKLMVAIARAIGFMRQEMFDYARAILEGAASP